MAIGDSQPEARHDLDVGASQGSAVRGYSPSAGGGAADHQRPRRAEGRRDFPRGLRSALRPRRTEDAERVAATDEPRRRRPDARSDSAARHRVLSFLLDTNALSEPGRLSPDAGFMDWYLAQESAE